jgi:hypothetical protein
MTDPYNNFLDTVSAPARSAKAVTTHNTNPLPGGACKALFVGGSGNIACRLMGDDTDVTFTGLTAGTILPVRATHVRTTSTTATAIVALY